MNDTRSSTPTSSDSSITELNAISIDSDRAHPEPEKAPRTLLAKLKRSRLIRGMRWILLIVVLIGLGSYLKNNSSELSILTRIDTSLVLSVCLIHGLLLMVSSEQFFIVAKRFHPSMHYGAWTELFIISRFLNRFVPQAGNAYRISALKLVHGFPVSDYLISFSIFSLLNRVITAWCVVGALILFEPTLTMAGIWFLPVVSAIALGSSLVIYLISMTSHRWGGLLGRFAPRLFRAELQDKFVSALKDLPMIILLILWGIVGFSLSVGAHALCFNAFGTELSFARLGILKFVKSTVDVISLTPGNFGITESVYAMLSKAMDDSVTAGIVVAAFMNITAVIATSAMGLTLLLYRSIKGGGFVPEEDR